MKDFNFGDHVFATWGSAWKKATVISVHHDGYVISFNDDSKGAYHRDLSSISKLPPDLHADYPGGADQYAADVATLMAAGAMGMAIEKEDGEFDESEDSDWSSSEDETGYTFWCYNVYAHTTEPERKAVSHSIRVASALSRFMPWTLPRLID